MPTLELGTRPRLVEGASRRHSADERAGWRGAVRYTWPHEAQHPRNLPPQPSS